MRSASDQITRLKLESEQRISALDSWILHDCPPERYLSFYDDLPGVPGYRFVPQMAQEFCKAVEERAGLDGLEAYHRLAMLQLISEGEKRLQSIKITVSIRSLVFDYFDRILKDMEAPRKRFYLHSNDRFAKDFAVCRLKLLPCGVELVDVRSGVARSILTKGGIRQLLSGLRLFYFRLGGFKPYYEIHFDQRLVSDFNEVGYTKFYLRLADLIELNPHIKGITSGSWWHDPQLADISPELGFIGKCPESNGAKLILDGVFDEATVDATRFSATRTKLHKEGVYNPQVYLMVWGREDMLAWAKEYRSRSSHASAAEVLDLEHSSTPEGVPS